LAKTVEIIKPEFYKGLNSIQDIDILKSYCDRVKKKKINFNFNNEILK
jgi:hypothetical protein